MTDIEINPTVVCGRSKFKATEFAYITWLDSYKAALRAGYPPDDAEDIGFANYYRVMKSVCHPDHPWLKEHAEWAKENAQLVAGKYRRINRVSVPEHKP